MTRPLIYRTLLTALLFAVPGSLAQEIRAVSAAELEAALQETARTMNATLPRMVDDEVQLTSTKGGNRRFQLNYTFVNFPANKVDPTVLHTRQLKNRTESICINGNMREFIDYGASISYAYFGNDGKKITTVTITPAMCKRMDATRK